MVLKYKNIHKIFQMAINYINIFPYKALKNFPKFGFLVRKETIWQPWQASMSSAATSQQKPDYGFCRIFST
jgi:hypothetical protein